MACQRNIQKEVNSKTAYTNSYSKRFYFALQPLFRHYLSYCRKKIGLLIETIWRHPGRGFRSHIVAHQKTAMYHNSRIWETESGRGVCFFIFPYSLFSWSGQNPNCKGKSSSRCKRGQCSPFVIKSDAEYVHTVVLTSSSPNHWKDRATAVSALVVGCARES